MAIRHLRDGKGPTLERLADLSHVANLSTAAVSGLTLLARDLQGLALAPTLGIWSRPIFSIGLTAVCRWRRPRRCQPGCEMSLSGNCSISCATKARSFRATDPAHARRSRPPTCAAGRGRDPRQFPLPPCTWTPCALMTVHGSKGLEFEAVLPGLTQASFPSSYRGSALSPAGRPHLGRRPIRAFQRRLSARMLKRRSVCSSSRCRAPARIWVLSAAVPGEWE